MKISKSNYSIEQCPRDGECVLHGIAKHTDHDSKIWLLKSPRKVLQKYISFFLKTPEKLTMNGITFEAETLDRSMTQELYLENIMKSNFYFGIFEMGLLAHMTMNDVKMLNLRDKRLMDYTSKIIGRPFVIFQLNESTQELSLVSIQTDQYTTKKPITLVHRYTVDGSGNVAEHYDSVQLLHESDYQEINEKIRVLQKEQEGATHTGAKMALPCDDISSESIEHALIHMKKIHEILGNMFLKLDQFQAEAQRVTST